MIIGAIVIVVLALAALLFSALLLASAWNGIREELIPGFRIKPPGPATRGLAVLGVAGPAILTALFTGYFALRLIGLLLTAQ